MEKLRNIVLAVLVVIFAVLMVSIFGLNERMSLRHLPIFVLLAMACAFFVLGIVEVILSVKIKEAKVKKVFFTLAGASAAGIPLCAVLHNVVYGLFFAGKTGDEAVFFILAVLVCPILFAVGALGSVICGIVGMKK
ncbi:MAG: hypothetical protein LLF92_04815 [Planctomycetaceae bacterium]|nr:hypothetical protein [Planctomycetaceae bacterium]